MTPFKFSALQQQCSVFGAAAAGGSTHKAINCSMSSGTYRATRVNDNELLYQTQHYAMMQSISAMQENQHMSVEEIRLKATSIPEKGFSFGAPASTSSGFGSAAGISSSLGGPAGTSSSSSGNSASTRTSEMEKNDSEKEKESMHDEEMEKKVEDDCHFSSKWFQKSRDAFTLNAFGGVTRSFDTREALLQKARNAPPVMLKKYDGYIDRTIHAFEDEFEKCIINLRKRLMLTDNCDAEERLG